jgi:hypothetical protein
VDQAGARSTNVVSTVGGFGTKSTRSASAYLTLRPGSEEGWSITSGKLESGSEVSVGACGETASSRVCLSTGDRQWSGLPPPLWYRQAQNAFLAYEFIDQFFGAPGQVLNYDWPLPRTPYQFVRSHSINATPVVTVLLLTALDDG